MSKEVEVIFGENSYPSTQKVFLYLTDEVDVESGEI